ncbi:hypothetical protein MRB53_031318 [Persea americana]|uniref:Uncharacterized protein n=1 Tax=Persea americana TaxID=3435 RepID=A0ACC2KNN1_PERAE|nr:hypothetical protein MRB53_031318 [Persea americana]
MIVNILEIGVSVGVKAAIKWGLGQEEDVVELVKMEEVKKAVERLMDAGEEGEERRKRAREFGVNAKTAMEEGVSITQIAMASLQEHQQPHFLMIPLMAQGHMIPMMDMAKLLAQRGAVITFITTPLNAARLRTTVDRTVNSSDLQIRLVELRFPCLEAGLPDGYENLDMVPFAADMAMKFFVAIEMLQQPVEKLLQEHEHPLPSCMISDMSISWTSEIAQKFCIPRLVFHGTSSFSLLCSYNVRHCNAHESVGSESEPFLIPGLPHRIEITKAQLPSSFVTNSDMQHLRDKIRKAESSADGVVLNSFDELEMEYVDMYRKATGKRTWAVGPVSLCNKETLDKMEEIRKVIERLMDEGEEGEVRRKRAREFGVKAKRAMEEGGGSSYINMTHLIEDAMELSNICLAKKQSADEFKLQREANNSTNGC